MSLAQKADRQMVSFDRPKLARLKKRMLENDDDVFEFEGQQYVRGYAKYLVQYLESQLPPAVPGARTKA
jgi:hypothetical protein